MSGRDPEGTVLPWKGDASAEVQPEMHLLAPQDLWRPSQGMDWLRMTRCRFEPLAAVAPVTGHPSLQAWCQVDTAQEADKSQSFGFAAVLAAPEVVSSLAVAHFVVVIAAAVAVASAECVAVAPGAVAGDTVAACAAFAAVAFVAVGFVAAVAAEGGAAAAGAVVVVAVAAGDGDAFVAAASGGAVVVEF